MIHHPSCPARDGGPCDGCPPFRRKSFRFRFNTSVDAVRKQTRRRTSCGTSSVADSLIQWVTA